MSILPTWPIAAGALVIGLAVGAFIDHRIMQGRIDKITIAHSEELRVREVKRADDERAARDKEQSLTARVGEIEQEKQREIENVSADAAALLARVRNQAASKPANPSRVPTATSNCQEPARADLPERTGVDLISLAERADQQRAALSACYQAYDSVSKY